MLSYHSPLTPEYVAPISLPPNCQLPIVLIGLGGSGAQAVAGAYRKLKNAYPYPIKAYAIDTDAEDLALAKNSGVDGIPIQKYTSLDFISYDQTLHEIAEDLFGDSSLIHLYGNDPEMRRSFYSRTATFISLRQAFFSNKFKEFEDELLTFLKNHQGAMIYLVAESSGYFGSAALAPLAARIERLSSDHNIQTSINAVTTSPELALSMCHGEPHNAARSYAMLKELLILQYPTLPAKERHARLFGFYESDCKKRLFSSIRIVEYPRELHSVIASTKLVENSLTATVLSKKVFHPHAALSRIAAKAVLLDKRALAHDLANQHIREFAAMPFYRALRELIPNEDLATVVNTAITLIGDIRSGKREDGTDGILTRLAINETGLPTAVCELLQTLEEDFVQKPSDLYALPDFDTVIPPFSKPKGLLTSASEKRALQEALWTARKTLIQAIEEPLDTIRYGADLPREAYQFAKELFTPAHHAMLGITKENGQYAHPLYTLLTLCFLRHALYTRLQSLQNKETTRKDLLIADRFDTENASPALLKAMKKSGYYRYGEDRLLLLDREICEDSRHPYEDLLILQKDIEKVKYAARKMLFDRKREHLYCQTLSMLDKKLEAYIKSLNYFLTYYHRPSLTDSYPHTYAIDTSRHAAKDLLTEEDRAHIQNLCENGWGQTVYEDGFSPLNEAKDKIVSEVYAEKLAKLSVLEELKKERGIGYADALKGALAACQGLPNEFKPTALFLPHSERAIIEAWRDAEIPITYDLFDYPNPRPSLEEFLRDKLGLSVTVSFIDSKSLDNDRILLLYETPFIKPATYDPFTDANSPTKAAYRAYQNIQDKLRNDHLHMNPHIFYAFNLVTLPFEEDPRLT